MLALDIWDNMEDSSIQGSGIFGAVKQALGLFTNINKDGASDKDNIKEEDEFTSKMSDTDILSLVAQWKAEYAQYYLDIKKSQDKCFDYWIGKQKVDIQDTLDGRNIVVNKMFEAIETFIPIATRANPEPLVSSDTSPEGQELAKDLKNTLVYQADIQHLKRKLAKMTRQWMLNLIGAIEIEYDLEIDDIKTSVIQPKRFIFDKDGHIDESGRFIGEFVGLECKDPASKLGAMFPSFKGFIDTQVSGKKGTKLKYFKWWYRGSEVFYTMNGKVLGKFKNPHWNYDVSGKPANISPEGVVVEEATEAVTAVNHLEKPMAPYVFLSIFNTGNQPHDETGLILQNLSQQDQINKRHRQLDKNIDSQNNGIVVDGRVMTHEQAAEAASAKRRGAAIVVNGNPKEAVSFDAAPQLSSDVWTAVNKAEQDLANIFGTSGSTPQGVASEDTARGKIMVSQMDASRIGGGITEYIEQVADTIYNWMVQMMVVHYDNEHFVNILGEEEGQNTKPMSNSRFVKSVRVTVKEGTLVPKDPLTERNEAVDLWSANAIDPVNLYKKLDFPDPNSAAQSLILWQMLQKGAIQPQMYLPSFALPSQPAPLPTEQPATGGPAVNAPTGQPIENPPSAQPGTQEGADIQGKQLLASVPVK